MGKLRIAICFLLFTACCSAVDYRLPQTVVPTSYDIFLTIDPDKTDYTGTVKISLRTTTDSDEIYIHEDGDNIVIGSAKVNDEDCTADTTDVADIVKISCPSALKKDEDSTLSLEFSGKFSEDGYGLVKSTYKDGTDDQVIIESNFKPTYARRAFPCLDEPDFKATFSVEITHPKGYNAISNSPVSKTKDSEDGTQTTTTFEKTPEISTYLLSIFISKFQEAKTSSEEKVDFKIYTRPKVSTLTSNVANAYYHKIIEELDSYTGVRYEDLKDTESYLVAVPDYSDAMGDFGLFAYKETDLLDEGEKTTNRAKQNIITTMAYKLSHEWYGGDVATKWWSDVWANEAVATYLKYVIPDEIDSELELTNQFLLEVSQKLLQKDAYNFAQPLSSTESEINSDWTIENKLNTVNYEKGASILQMINLILGGNDKFKSALQTHLNSRKDADTDGTDILKDLLQEKTTDETDYYTYLEKWAFSAGYPLLTVSLEEVNDTDTVKITQKRFLYPTTETFADDESGWYVPLTAASQTSLDSNVHVSIFLNPDKETMFNFEHGKWLVLNSQGGCFYRVNYDEALWRRIFDGLSSDRTDFHVLQRSQIVDDIFNTARTGDVSYSLAFELADSLIDETEYYPWYSALNAFSYLLGKMKDEDIELNLKNYILNLMEKVIVIPSDKFVDDSDTHVDVLKKVIILKWACELGHEDCIKYATEKFKSYKESQTSLDDYNAREVIFCNGIRHSENAKEDWDFLWKIYSDSLSVHEQNDILKALGCAENKDLLKSYLQKIITADSGIKTQDAVLVFNSVLSSSLGLEVAKEFLQDKFSDIQTFFSNMQILSELVYALAEKLISDEDVEWLNNLLANTILNDYEDVKTKANTLTSVNNYWLKNYQSDVTDLFAKPSSSTEASTSTSETTITTSTKKSTSTEEPTSTEESTSTEEPTSTQESTSTDEPTSTNEDDVTTTEPTSTTEAKSNIISFSKYILLCLVLFASLC